MNRRQFVQANGAIALAAIIKPVIAEETKYIWYRVCKEHEIDGYGYIPGYLFKFRQGKEEWAFVSEISKQGYGTIASYTPFLDKGFGYDWYREEDLISTAHNIYVTNFSTPLKDDQTPYETTSFRRYILPPNSYRIGEYAKPISL